MPNPTVKNVSGSALSVPSLGGRLVVADATVEVPAGGVYGFTCQESNWVPANELAKKEHKRDHDAQLERNNPAPPEEPADAPVDVESDEKEN